MTVEAQEILQSLGNKMVAGETVQEADVLDRSMQTNMDNIDMDRELERLREENKRLKEENKKLKEENGRLTKKAQASTTLTEEILSKVETYEDLRVNVHKEWLENICKTAFKINGNPMKANKDTDLLMLSEATMGGNNMVNKGTERSFEERYPEL